MVARRAEDFESAAGTLQQEESSDRRLALAFKRGEPGAYDAIYDLYETRVRMLCRRMLGDHHDAEEATQETFLRVYQGLGRFNGRYQLGAWTTRIATNVCLDHLRARSRRPSDPMPVEQMELDPEPEEHTDPEILFIRHAEGRRVRKVLASLPPMHKAAIVLRDFEGLSYAEVAIALGLSECQVKALLHRARKGFRRSWSAPGLAALLPWRFLPRFRKLDVAAKESTTQAVGPASQIMESAPHMAASCSTVLQQCGQIFSERAASLVTAAVVGTAATGLAIGAPDVIQHGVLTEIANNHSIADAELINPAADTKKQAHASASKPQSPTASAAPVTEPSASPSPTPSASEQPPPDPSTPAPTPTASPGGSGDDSSKPKEDKPEPKPTPPFTPSVGFNGEAITMQESVSHKLSMSCPGRWLTQRLETSTSLQGTSSPVSLYLSVGPTTARLELDVFQDGRRYPYSSWGESPTATWSVEGRDGLVEVSGAYGPLYGWSHEEADLPGPGHFTARLALDCATKSVVTESVLFTVD